MEKGVRPMDVDNTIGGDTGGESGDEKDVMEDIIFKQG